MGQANNNHRNASLDSHKRRAAGREGQHSPEVEAIKDAQAPLPAKGHTGGAFGKQGQAQRRPHAHTQGGGGGGGAQSIPKDASSNQSDQSNLNARSDRRG